MRLSDPTSHLRRARTLLSGAQVSLEHCLAADTDADLQVRTEQQADWIIAELEHAIAQMKAARVSEGVCTMAAEGYVPAIGKAA